MTINTKKADYLERIAKALENHFGVTPSLIAGRSRNTKYSRIADALEHMDGGFGTGSTDREQTITIPASTDEGWVDGYITLEVAGVSATSINFILPLVLEGDNIASIKANNESLEALNLQDAGQSTGMITVYTDNPPATAIQARCVIYG